MQVARLEYIVGVDGHSRVTVKTRNVIVINKEVIKYIINALLKQHSIGPRAV